MTIPPSVLAVLVSAGLPVAAPSKPAPPSPDILVKNDVPYATVDGVKLELDFAAPKAGGPHPCVVLLHGGAWKMGSRKELSRRPPADLDFGTDGKSLTEILAERGYAAASVSYRLAPKGKFPAQIQDVKTAVRYLRANAKDLNIDPDRIAAYGFSAGGHLAALLGTTAGLKEFEGDLYPEQSSTVCCVVNFFGPADLSLYCETPGIEKAFFKDFLVCTPATKADVFAKASPITHASKASVPFIHIHGTADVVVPVVHSEAFHKKLVEVGAKSTLVEVKGKGHGWFGRDFADSSETAFRFLGEHLKGTK